MLSVLPTEVPTLTRFSALVLSRLRELTNTELTAWALLVSCLVSFRIPVAGSVLGCIVVGWLLGQAQVKPPAAIPALWGAVIGGALPQTLTLGITDRKWGMLLAMIILSAYAGVFRWLSTLTYHEELERRSSSRRNS